MLPLPMSIFMVIGTGPPRTGSSKRAIALAPGLARSHRWYAVYLAAMGRAAEAMTEAQRAADLDPLSVSAHDAAAIAAVCSGQYDRSIEEGRIILDLDPKMRGLTWTWPWATLRKECTKRPCRTWRRVLVLSRRDPFFLSIAALIHGRLGQMEQASKLVEEMRAASQKSFVAPFLFATAFVGMGKEKESMDALEEGFKAHDGYLVGLNSTPWFGPLRSYPHFQDLVTRMHLPPVTHREQQ